MQFFLNTKAAIVSLVGLSVMSLTACQTHRLQPHTTLSATAFKTVAIKQKVEAAQLINTDALEANGVLATADMIVATKKNGLMVLNKNGETLSQLKGYFTTLDHRVNAQSLMVASVEGDLQQVLVTTLNAQSGFWNAPLIVPKPSFKIEDACLYEDSAQNTFVFLVGEEGLGEQWLVATQANLLKAAARVRQLSLPPASQFCQVDDQRDTLYVNEENVGLWAYAAHAEAELSREAVAMTKPFGDIAKNVAGMSVAQSQVFVLDAESEYLHRYDLSRSKKLSAIDVTALNQPENISTRVHHKTIDVLIHDEDGLHLASLPNEVAAQPSVSHSKNTSVVVKAAVVKPLVQTDAIPSLGDAADDPAIWVHPTDATKSLVLGTDKQGGLAVYNLQGIEQQYLPVGRLNNVDIRANFNLNGKLIDLAVASNRDHHSLHLFSIDRESGVVTALGEQGTSINDIYGLCMFKDKQNRVYAIVNDKNGTFEQYDLTVFDRHIAANKVRSFKVATQPEGCVADDQTEQLFIGEEAKAVWALDARADALTTMTQVIATGDIVHADIEGLAYYRGAKNQYLVISSQGNDSYAVVEAAAPYRFRGSFTIGINASLLIDGASETDGLEVTSADLSGHNTGPWRLGMLVVQDGRKRMPEGQQNFKYVPWTAIADALNLE